MTQAAPGRIVVVTGGAVGIGRATTIAFSELGDSVYVIDIDPDAGSEVAGLSEHATFLHCDVTNPEAVTGAMKLIGEESKRVDVLVNNAGGFPSPRTLEDTSFEEWRQILDLNLTSVFLTTQAALPLLRRSESGRIINLGSLAGQLNTWRTAPPYVAAKAGVHGLTRLMASELAEDGITVNALAPSAVMTERIERLRDRAELKATAATIPLGRYQSPEEVAAWVLFLASSKAGFMTGQTVSVNGGRFMT